MKEEYLKAVDDLIDLMYEGARTREDEWIDKDEFKEYFVKNYGMFESLIEAMVIEDGFSMREAVMFIYGYSMGRSSVIELIDLGDSGALSH